MSHEWGNYPENFTPKMYWGARAILERDSGGPGKALYLLPDRQSFERLDGSQRRLFHVSGNAEGQLWGIPLHRLLGGRAAVHDNKTHAADTAPTGTYPQ